MKAIVDMLPGKANGTIWRNRIVGEGTEQPDQLLANPQNWRVHPRFQQDVLTSILAKVGWMQRVIVNKTTGHLIDGHLRVTLAMRHMEPTIPVQYVELTEEEEQLILATLDPIAGLAVADDEKLRELMAEIQSDDSVIQAMMDAIRADAGILEEDVKPDDPGAQVDRAEELQERWQVKAGDIWRMGDHLVICGDCREPETWARLLKAVGVEKVNGVFTSPPYAEQRKKQYGGTPTDKYVEWWDAVQSNVRANLADDGSFFVNIKPHCEDGQRVLYVFDLVLAMVRRWGWRFVDELCWQHPNVPGTWPNRFKNNFEPVFHFTIDKPKFRPKNATHKSDAVRKGPGGSPMLAYDRIDLGPKLDGDALSSNVISTGTQVGQPHEAAFPVKLPDFFIKAYSDEYDVWCDPFIGSGTTIIAAHQNGRRGVGIERLEKYVAVTLQRWQDLTGGNPVLVTDG